MGDSGRRVRRAGGNDFNDNRGSDPLRALLPLALNAASGPFIQTYLAQISLLSGDLDKAVATLRPPLTFPSWITPAELTSDPLWAPLRTHPGFTSLTAPTP